MTRRFKRTRANAERNVPLFATGAILSLIVLHFLSPEFDPSWRMVSEYALGQHKWLLTFFFLFWSISSLDLSYLVNFEVSNRWEKVGMWLLFVSGIGEAFGAFFDVKHPFHGLAFALGVPTVPIAALLLQKKLKAKFKIFAHLPWISFVIMGISMAMFISGLKERGLFDPENPGALTALPEGMTAFVGYANRFLIFCYCSWLIVLSKGIYEKKHS